MLALEKGIGGYLIQPTHAAEIPEQDSFLSMMEFSFPGKRDASDSANHICHVLSFVEMEQFPSFEGLW